MVIVCGVTVILQGVKLIPCQVCSWTVSGCTTGKRCPRARHRSELTQERKKPLGLSQEHVLVLVKVEVVEVSLSEAGSTRPCETTFHLGEGRSRLRRSRPGTAPEDRG